MMQIIESINRIDAMIKFREHELSNSHDIWYSAGSYPQEIVDFKDIRDEIIRLRAELTDIDDSSGENLSRLQTKLEVVDRLYKFDEAKHCYTDDLDKE